MLNAPEVGAPAWHRLQPLGTESEKAETPGNHPQFGVNLRALARAGRHRFSIRRQVRIVAARGGRSRSKRFLALAVKIEGKLFGNAQRNLRAGAVELPTIALLGRGPDYVAILITESNGGAGLMLANSVALRLAF